jgi:putative nucleotidyltransferase with HDIG domain
MSDRIERIEAYARSRMTGALAHDYKHVDRVRHWALRIAQAEGYPNLDQAAAAALLHDIGLSSTGRQNHAAVGAELAESFLKAGQLFSDSEIADIADAIRRHSSLQGEDTLMLILRDADTLDLLGPVGLIRAFVSKYDQPDYPPDLIKGETWGFTAEQFTQRFGSGLGIGEHIVDQINFQMSCAGNLNTASARRFGQPLVAFMRVFMLELETQVSANASGL